MHHSSSQTTSLQDRSNGIFARLHHDAGDLARAANRFAGLAARRARVGDLDAAEAARLISRAYRERLGWCAQKAQEARYRATLDLISGEDLERAWSRSRGATYAHGKVNR